MEKKKQPRKKKSGKLQKGWWLSILPCNFSGQHGGRLSSGCNVHHNILGYILGLHYIGIMEKKVETTIIECIENNSCPQFQSSTLELDERSSARLRFQFFTDGFNECRSRTWNLQ